MIKFVVFVLLSMHLFGAEAPDNNSSSESNVSMITYETPFEHSLKESFGSKGSTYNMFVTFFSKNKTSNINVVTQLLNSQDKYLGYYEGVLKALYYMDLNDSSNAILLANTVYDRAKNKLEDSSTGVFLQDLYIYYNDLKKAKELISTKEFCLSIGDKNTQKGCYENNLLLECIEKDIPEEIILSSILNIEDISINIDYVQDLCKKLK